MNKSTNPLQTLQQILQALLGQSGKMVSPLAGSDTLNSPNLLNYVDYNQQMEQVAANPMSGPTPTPYPPLYPGMPKQGSSVPRMPQKIDGMAQNTQANQIMQKVQSMAGNMGGGISQGVSQAGTSFSGNISAIGKIINDVATKISGGNDPEWTKVAHAIALAESGGNPNAVGDGGNSIGLYQNNMAAGRGYGHDINKLKDPTYNANLSLNDLYTYYKQGKKQGLSGANLVAYVSRNGQRPAPGNEWQAAKNYGRYVGQEPVVTNEPQMMKHNAPTTMPQAPKSVISPLPRFGGGR